MLVKYLVLNCCHWVFWVLLVGARASCERDIMVKHGVHHYGARYLWILACGSFLWSFTKRAYSFFSVTMEIASEFISRTVASSNASKVNTAMFPKKYTFPLRSAWKFMVSLA